jgi:hypothetical protein
MSAVNPESNASPVFALLGVPDVDFSQINKQEIMH